MFQPFKWLFLLILTLGAIVTLIRWYDLWKAKRAVRRLELEHRQLYVRLEAERLAESERRRNSQDPTDHVPVDITAPAPEKSVPQWFRSDSARILWDLEPARLNLREAHRNLRRTWDRGTLAQLGVHLALWGLEVRLGWESTALIALAILCLRAEDGWDLES